jgi:translation initiation factor 1A
LDENLQNKGKGGKNRRRGKNENESEKRELVFKDEGQGEQQTGTPSRRKVQRKLMFHRSHRICSSREDAWQWPVRSSVLRWREATGTHPRKAQEEGKRQSPSSSIINACADWLYYFTQVWINQGDIILLSLRDFQDDKADVIQKYSPDEARELKKYGQLPESAKINEAEADDGDEGSDVEFENSSDEEDDGDL